MKGQGKITTLPEMKPEQGTTPRLMQFTIGKRTYGFVEGPDGYIVTENDFCHFVRSLNENIELRAYAPWEEKGAKTFEILTREQIRAMLLPIPSYREWVHYWGIKPRIASNYNDFKASMREIGLSTDHMPKFGDEPNRNPQRGASRNHLAQRRVEKGNR